MKSDAPYAAPRHTHKEDDRLFAVRWNTGVESRFSTAQANWWR